MNTQLLHNTVLRNKGVGESSYRDNAVPTVLIAKRLRNGDGAPEDEMQN
jgi:hypothetical protein